jgi:hypothetical protein
VPTEALATIHHKAAFEVERILEIEAEVRHDVIAFLTNAKRKTIVELVFGQTKEARGLRRFLLRGLTIVNGEWLLWGMTHNINKLWRHLKEAEAPGGDGNGIGGQAPTADPRVIAWSLRDPSLKNPDEPAHEKCRAALEG